MPCDEQIYVYSILLALLQNTFHSSVVYTLFDNMFMVQYINKSIVNYNLFTDEYYSHIRQHALIIRIERHIGAGIV